MESKVSRPPDYLQSFQKYLFQCLDQIWDWLPRRVGFLVAAILAVVALSLFKGNWLLVALSLRRQLQTVPDGNETFPIPDDSQRFFLDTYHLRDLPSYLMWSMVTSFSMYLPVGLFYHWYFYYKQRATPDVWKIQPRKFLTWDEQKDEILFGLSSMTIGTVVASVFTCYLNNGGPYSTLYFDLSEKGLLYYCLSIPALFLYIDGTVYYAHRLYHVPFLYRAFHKYHHKYKHPTAFGATAMHPLELLTYELLSYIPLFLFPIHWTVFAGHSMYVFYYSLEAHCGVKTQSIWPWQPSTVFHDNHHQYTHYNFGFNLVLWDKLHGTYRVKEN